MSSQSTFGAFTPQPDPEPDSYEGRPLDPDTGCPWCLAPPRAFATNETNGKRYCRLCSAVQPTHMEWYQNGRKIADVQGVANMYQGYWAELFGE